MSKLIHTNPDIKCSMYSYSKICCGKPRQEVLTLIYPAAYTADQIFHHVGLQIALRDIEPRSRYREITFEELLDRLDDTMLAPYEAHVLRSSNEADQIDGKASVVSRNELDSYRVLHQKTQQRIRKMREYAGIFARRLEKEKANGHPVISTWNSLAISSSAVAWAEQFAWEEDADFQKFVKQKLEEAKPVVQNTPASEKPVA